MHPSLQRSLSILTHSEVDHIPNRLSHYRLALFMQSSLPLCTSPFRQLQIYTVFLFSHIWRPTFATTKIPIIIAKRQYLKWGELTNSSALQAKEYFFQRAVILLARKEKPSAFCLSLLCKKQISSSLKIPSSIWNSFSTSCTWMLLPFDKSVLHSLFPRFKLNCAITASPISCAWLMTNGSITQVLPLSVQPQWQWIKTEHVAWRGQVSGGQGTILPTAMQRSTRKARTIARQYFNVLIILSVLASLESQQNTFSAQLRYLMN